MDQRTEIRDFLVTRRAKITPALVGLPAGNGRRRVPGLRREEVAVLAGVSTEWYTRLEKGYIGEVSDDVLAAVARALQLSSDEQVYLFDLARLARRAPARPTGFSVAPRVQWLLDAMTMSAAFVRVGCGDVVASNALARALHAPMFSVSGRPNIARYIFLDPGAREFFVDWTGVGAATTAMLRAEAGRRPGDAGLHGLIGELATKSPEFRGQWATHDVRIRHEVTKQIRHPEVGDLELTYQSLPLPEQPGAELTTYTAAPGSPSEERLQVLASWAATASRLGQA